MQAFEYQAQTPWGRVVVAGVITAATAAAAKGKVRRMRGVSYHDLIILTAL